MSGTVTSGRTFLRSEEKRLCTEDVVSWKEESRRSGGVTHLVTVPRNEREQGVSGGKDSGLD